MRVKLAVRIRYDGLQPKINFNLGAVMLNNFKEKKLGVEHSFFSMPCMCLL
jgi:hypothetical protein